LVGDYAPAGAWTPVSQSTSTLGEQRFDYYFPAASLTNPGLPQVNNCSNNLDLCF